MIELICEHCGCGMRLPAMFRGQVVKCVRCWEEVRVSSREARAEANGGMSDGVAWMERVDGGQCVELLLEGQPESVHEWVAHEKRLCDTVEMLKEKCVDGSGETGMWDVRELAARETQGVEVGEVGQGAGETGLDLGMDANAEMHGVRVVGDGGHVVQQSGATPMGQSGAGQIRGEAWIGAVGELSEEEVAAEQVKTGVDGREEVVTRMIKREVAARREALGLKDMMKKHERPWGEGQGDDEDAVTHRVGWMTGIAGLLVAVVGGLIWAALVSVLGMRLGFVAIGIGLLVGWVMMKLSVGRHRDLGLSAAVLTMVFGVGAGKVGVGVFGLEKLVGGQVRGVMVDELYVEMAVVSQMVVDDQLDMANWDSVSDLEWGEPIEGRVSDVFYAKIREKVEGLDEQGRAGLVSEHWGGKQASRMELWDGVMATVWWDDVLWVLLCGGAAYWLCAGKRIREEEVEIVD
ncbi:hypothetical protein KS4_24470 [Poriferisphaera corsica]|uniref:Uncharacterized protein n=1 Tax=Poriferisphaera corsica TaxID=2528020 RepID=A0A517YVY5_9BACT|nr:hypothetical protein [Poriferisphaera corsica]QDU34379.1 hypothetical protein KS4_24470 [Poriferisphaera corsica]